MLVALLVSLILGAIQSFSEALGRFSVSGEYTMPYYPPGRANLCERPVWSGGAFVRCEVDGVTTPVIHSIDATGQDSLVVFSLSGATTINVRGIAHGRSNALALVGTGFDGDGHLGHFVSWVSPDRKVINTMRTTGYVPNFVSIAPDGTMWTVGWEPSDHNNAASPLNPEAYVLRHFDSSVKLVDAFVPQHTMSRHHLTGTIGYLASSSSRVGWYQDKGPYLEVTFADKKVTEYPGISLHAHEIILGLAIVDDGSVFVNTSAYEGSRGFHLYELDRKRAEWVPLDWPTFESTQPKLWNLLGGDGDTLMFRTSTEGRSRALTVK
jgi:hypothetical protein